jgi:hypothetical protein
VRSASPAQADAAREAADAVHRRLAVLRAATQFHIEFSGISPYDNDADEFVRRGCREYAGWRREEWAYSPLFIWGKTLGQDFEARTLRKSRQIVGVFEPHSQRLILVAGVLERC